jgi:uncharacterized protein YecE (DUF72 family)
MSKAACDIRIGTSGWYYEYWKKLFYPPDMPKSKWFEYYARQFDTVEINNTFYHQPKEQSIRRWQKNAPEGFLYAVKANRYITHIKKLKDTSESLQRFFDGIDLLKRKLGHVLYQLPPSHHIDLDRLGDFIRLLPKRKTAVFEFRHKSWYCKDTYKLLEKCGAGFCIHDMPGNESPQVATSDKVYVRFHGTAGRYSGNYPESALRNWAGWIKDKSKKVSGVYVYFNNDPHGHAVINAKQLKEMII